MAPSLRQNPRKTPKALNAAASVSSKEEEEEQEQQSSNMLQQAPPKTLTSKTSLPLTSSFVAARASAQKNHTITHDLLLKSTVSDGSHRKVGDGTNVKTTARAAGGILGGTVTPSKRPLKPPTAQGFIMGNKRPKTTNNDESASSSSSRQNVEKKDAKTIANALQAALMKERIQSGRDLDENFGKNDPMALIAELQDVIMEETIQHRMALEEGTKRLTNMEQYKRRAHEAENKLKVKTEEANQARDDLEQMKQDLATVLDENGEMERRLSGIVAMATGEQPQQQQQQQQLEEERVQEVAVAVTPTLKKEPRARWHSDEMMNLYRLCHSIGSNDWEKIVATGEIPSKTGQQMSSKWSDARKCKKYNPLEKAFSDAKAQVAKQIGDVKVVGTVVDYVLDEKSREGTWTIVWGDGTAEEITKDKLLSSLNLYDEMKKESKHDERE